MKQWYIFEMNGFTEDESQELFNQVFAEVEWEENQGMGISHLTEKGVSDLKKYVFKQEEAE